MKFIKYPSLENHYREKFIDAVLMTDAVDDTWVATEKLHGANFSLWSDGLEVKAAKRSSFIKEGESFYGCTPVVERYTDAVRNLANDLNKTIVVFGELVGEGVQKGVNYTQGKDFYAFDLAEVCADGTLDFYAYNDSLRNMLQTYGFKNVPKVGEGSFKDMFALNNLFESTLGSKDFTAEGIVIKPQHSVYLSSGSKVAIKSKNDKFSETSKTPKVKKEVPVAVVQTVSLCIPYFTTQRFDNVLSKEGEFDKKLFGKYIGLLSHDALEECIKDHELELDESEVKSIKKSLAVHARNVIKQYT